MTHARGNYQRGLIGGFGKWSGSNLKGAAKNYSGRYAASRDNLYARLAADRRLEVFEERRAHGLRVLVIRLADAELELAYNAGLLWELAEGVYDAEQARLCALPLYLRGLSADDRAVQEDYVLSRLSSQ